MKKEILDLTGDFSNFLKKNKLVVVDFYADWCMPCLMMSPTIEEFAEKNKKIPVVKINIDENEDFAKKYNVMSIPCVILFKDGQEVQRVIGNVPLEVLEEKFSKFMG